MSWFSKQELFISDSHGYVIVDTATGDLKHHYYSDYDTQILQCGLDKLEHPIIARVVVTMGSNGCVYWDHVLPVRYQCMSFAESHSLWWWWWCGLTLVW